MKTSAILKSRLIKLLAETEGVFTETGGVTAGTAGKLYRQDRIHPEETTVPLHYRQRIENHGPFRGRVRNGAPSPQTGRVRNVFAADTEGSEIPESSLPESERARRSRFKFRHAAPHGGRVHLVCSLNLGLLSVLDEKFPNSKPHLRDDRLTRAFLTST